MIYVRAGYWIGAVFELLAVIPMLSPALFGQIMGIADFRPASDYRYAMDIAAVFTLGWIALMIWADRKPIERRGVMLLSMIVFIGNGFCGIYAATSGLVSAPMMVPSWIVQLLIVALFGFGYSVANGLAKVPVERG